MRLAIGTVGIQDIPFTGLYKTSQDCGLYILYTITPEEAFADSIVDVEPVYRINKFKVFKEQKKDIGINCCLIDITPAPIREEITGFGRRGHIVP